MNLFKKSLIAAVCVANLGVLSATENRIYRADVLQGCCQSVRRSHNMHDIKDAVDFVVEHVFKKLSLSNEQKAQLSEKCRVSMEKLFGDSDPRVASEQERKKIEPFEKTFGQLLHVLQNGDARWNPADKDYGIVHLLDNAGTRDDYLPAMMLVVAHAAAKSLGKTRENLTSLVYRELANIGVHVEPADRVQFVERYGFCAGESQSSIWPWIVAPVGVIAAGLGLYFGIKWYNGRDNQDNNEGAEQVA